MDRLRAISLGGREVSPDIVSGVALLLVAIAYGMVALGIPGGDGEPGPRAVPIALAVALVCLSLATVGRGLRAGAAQLSASGDQPATKIRPAGITTHSRRAWVAAGVTVLYVALYQPAGFVVSTLLYTAVLTRLYGGEGRTRVAVPVGVTLVLFAFFRLALGVRLPPGPLG